jgi:hypothetical protein
MFDSADVVRLWQMINAVRVVGSREYLSGMLPRGYHGAALNKLAGDCDFEHGGVLVFPSDVQSVVNLLLSAGLEVAAPVPSLLVKRRLCARYGLAEDAIDVQIVRGRPGGKWAVPREAEIFVVLARSAEVDLSAIRFAERAQENETHFSLFVRRPSERVLEGIRSTLLDYFPMVPDGAGYTPSETTDRGGRTVLYFSQHRLSKDWRWVRRLELSCDGHFPEIIAEHERDSLALVEARSGLVLQA